MLRHEHCRGSDGVRGVVCRSVPTGRPGTGPAAPLPPSSGARAGPGPPLPRREPAEGDRGESHKDRGGLKTTRPRSRKGKGLEWRDLLSAHLDLPPGELVKKKEASEPTKAPACVRDRDQRPLPSGPESPLGRGLWRRVLAWRIKETVPTDRTGKQGRRETQGRRQVNSRRRRSCKRGEERHRGLVGLKPLGSKSGGVCRREEDALGHKGFNGQTRKTLINVHFFVSQY